MTDALSRRDVLKLGAGLGLLALAPACADPPFDEGSCDPGPADGATPLAADPSKIAEDPELFTESVVAGSVATTSALVQMRVADETPKTLQVWRADAAGVLLLAKSMELTPVKGRLLGKLEGLAPNTRYSYAFSTQDKAKRSAVGSFRTAYDGDCRRALTVASTVCTSARNAPYKALSVTAKHDYDAVLHLGDMTYNDGAVTWDEYREKWHWTLQEPGYRAMLAKAGLIATWDDHEFTNNTQLESAAFPATQLETARGVFYDSLPIEPGPDGRLWRSHKWGKTAEFFVLDCRTERRPDTRTSDHAVYISDAQLAWLKDGLSKSDAHFKVILNSVPIIDFPKPIWILEQDRWQGYQQQREALLTHITTAGIENVWFLSGDVHTSAVARVELEGPRSKIWEILVGPGANFNPLWLVYTQGNEADREGIAPVEQFEYFGGEFSATLLTFDPSKNAVRAVFIEAATEKVLYDAWLTQDGPLAAT